MGPGGRGRQAGGAALILLLVLSGVAALIGALAVRGSVADLRAAGAVRSSKAAFYCAEAGINASRAYFAANQAQWAAMFDPGKTKPAGYPVTGDIDGDGVLDYSVTLRDNIDEFPPVAQNPYLDNDLTAIVVSTCIDPRKGSRTLQEIITSNARGTNYRSQAGHGSSRPGNQN